MGIIIRSPLKADDIKNLLDGNEFSGIKYIFTEKKGMEMHFDVEGEGDCVNVAKDAIKATDYGKVLYFSVIKK